MAALDKERLIVRVAYAGAPMAGKTESVRALLPLLKGRGAELKVMSPAEDRGRTAFFDWADYEGGAFEGKPIRCQITSAPGQVALSDRRELLLRGADAVILVVDSRIEAIERTQQCYEEMAPWLEDAGREVPIRVLLQCNKQDLPGSLTPQELSLALGLPFGKDVYPTSARTGKGLRAAFVAGVRVAVERAKAQIARGLISSAPEIASGEELFEVMQRDVAFQNLSRRHEPARPRAAESERKATPARAPESSPQASARAPASSPTSAALPRTASGLPSSPPPRATSSTKLRAARGQPAASEAPATPPAARAPEPEALPARSAAPRPPEPARAPQSAPASRVPEKAARAFAPFERAERSLPAPVASPPEAAASARAVASRAASKPAPSAAEREAPKRITWSPESGTRPAVMPASVYDAAMARLARSAPVPLPVKSPPPLAPARASAAQSSRAPAQPAKLGLAGKSGVRPAVMPASAYFASLGAVAPLGAPAAPAPPGKGVTTPASAVVTERLKLVAKAAQPLSGSGVRPAVMPASAWHTAEAQRASGGAARPLEHERPSRELEPQKLEPQKLEPQKLEPRSAPSSPPIPAPAPSPPLPLVEPQARTPLAAPAPSAAAAQRRPAVAPSSAWLAQHAAARSAAASAPPARRVGTPGSARPAVIPASAWDSDPSEWVAPAPREVGSGTPRPAVMPASAWRASLANMFRGASPANEIERAASERPTRRPPSAAPTSAVSSSAVSSSAVSSSAVSSSAVSSSAVSSSAVSSSALSHAQNGVGRYDDLASGPLASPFAASSAPPEPSSSMGPESYSWNGPGESEVAGTSVITPQLPGRATAPRSVWPRSIWRILEPQVTPNGRALEDARGRWLGELAPGWYARTLETAVDLKSGRRTFAGAVLRHRRLKPHLSGPRCLALTEEADRCWIWQIVYRVPTLAATLGKVLATHEAPGIVAEALVQCASGYLDARERFGALVEPLPLSLHALSAQAGQFVYAGLLPNSATTLSKPLGDPGAGFEEALRKRWPQEQPEDVQAILGELQSKAAGKLPEPIVDVIRSVLIGQ